MKTHTENLLSVRLISGKWMRKNYHISKLLRLSWSNVFSKARKKLAQWSDYCEINSRSDHGQI